MREEEIELQLVSKRGTRLVWKERSAAADSLVVLDEGAQPHMIDVLWLTHDY